jgi:excisionase family DNA binding protein
MSDQSRIAVSPGTAAEMLNISESSFYKNVMPYVRSGTIESLKIGASRRIVVESLMAWVRERAKEQEASHGPARKW